MLGWLRLCVWIVPFAAGSGLAFAQSGSHVAGSHVAGSHPDSAYIDGMAAEAAADADARRENMRGDETFQGTYACIAPSGASDKAPILCEGRIGPVLPEFYFALSWHIGEFGDREIDVVQIRRKGEAEAFQIVESVGSQAASQIPNNGFELIDINFDGYHDFRLIAGGSAGPNVLYRNWLWEPDEEVFVASAALDEIVSPEFDPETQEIVSRWRSSAAEGGVDIYNWEDGNPVLIHRETDAYAGPSNCTRTFYDRIDGELRETGTGACS